MSRELILPRPTDGIGPPALRDALEELTGERSVPRLAKVSAIALLGGDVELAARLERGDAKSAARDALQSVVDLIPSDRGLSPAGKRALDLVRSVTVTDNPAMPVRKRGKDWIEKSVTPELQLIRESRGKRVQMRGPDTVAEEFSYLAFQPFEEFWVAPVDNQHRIIGRYMVSRGGPSSAAVYVSEILRVTLFAGAAKMVVVHNHPSGSMRPSREDLAVTERIVEACRYCDMKLLDHIIVGLAEAPYFGRSSVMARDPSPGIPSGGVQEPGPPARGDLDHDRVRVAYFSFTGTGLIAG